MEPARTLSWFSAGAASAVATRLALREDPEALVVYCETGAEHPDNERFIGDCVRWFNQPVVRLKSKIYADTWAVFEKERYLSGVRGAKCTTVLKKAPRIAFQGPYDRHIFGYTADGADQKRFRAFKDNFPELNVRAPLIEQGLTKANVLALIKGAGIELPTMYKLGFHNNNCIPCVKASSPNYWALVRREFPAEFERMAKLSRELKVRLTIIKKERRYIDEIPADWPVNNPIAPACDFMCEVGADDEVAEAHPLFAASLRGSAA